jgi:methionyl-tRNA formyltransferase
MTDDALNPQRTSTGCTAIVFAYSNVGYRCLSVLLAHGVRVPLVVTHADAPTETNWFGSVATLASRHEICVATPESPDDPFLFDAAQRCRPDFVFSFYYRQMLGRPWLDLPRRGALNMHGSLLPKYRGRAPVNWAILKGERETGATLHYMVEKPDAGDIVGQQRVPILPDDSARDVAEKVAFAAELLLDLALPLLKEGRAQRRPQDLAAGSYFGQRRPEDGRIDWRQSNQDVHNLVRAVAPPYPGAFTTSQGRKITIHATRLTDTIGALEKPALYCRDGRCYAQCEDRSQLVVLSLDIDGSVYDETDLSRPEVIRLMYFDPA